MAETAADPFAALIAGSAERMAKLSEEGFASLRRNNGFSLERVRLNADVALAAKLGYPIPNPLDTPAVTDPPPLEVPPLEKPKEEEATA